MKKILSFLLVISFLITPCLTVFAGTSTSEDVPASVEKDSGVNKNVVIVSKDNVKKDKKESKDLIEEQDGYEEIYKISNWEIAKNIAKYLGITFINDVKSYIMLWPLFKVSEIISFLALYFSTYGFYKLTGIDIPAKVSGFFNKNESVNIIGQNLYNVIPLTLSSFLFKWGKDICFYLKSFS